MDQLLTKKDVAQRLGIHVNTLDRIRNSDDTFPAPLRFGPRTQRWRPADVQRWVDGQAPEEPAPSPRAKSAADHLGL